jgi:hypothetical protein
MNQLLLFPFQNGESRISTQQKLRTSWTWRIRIPSQTPRESQSIWSILAIEG